MVAGQGDTEIYRYLRNAIASGELEPGDRLPAERDLADQMKTARGPVRRAIQRLEREGSVVRHVGRGTFVFSPVPQIELNTTHSPDAASPLDVLEARMAIEPGFADLVVARASTNDFRNLSETLEQMSVAKSQQEFRELGYRFHMLLAKATRNPIIVLFFEQIIEARTNAGWGKLKGLNDTKEAQAVQVAANRGILDALKDRDADLARKRIRAHLGQMVSTVVFQGDET